VSTPAIELDAQLRLERPDDVGGGDRTEQLAALAGPGRNRDRRADQTIGQGLRGLTVAKLAGRTVAAHRLSLAYDTVLGLDRQPARYEEVARVAVGDVDDFARQAEADDLTGEDEFHLLTAFSA